MASLDLFELHTMVSDHREVSTPEQRTAITEWFRDHRGIDDVWGLGGTPQMFAANPDLMPDAVRGWARSSIRRRGPAILYPTLGSTSWALHFIRENRSVEMPGTRASDTGAPPGWGTLPQARAFMDGFTPTHPVHHMDVACTTWCHPRAVVVCENSQDAWAMAAVARAWAPGVACSTECGRDDCKRIRRPVAVVAAGWLGNWPRWVPVLERYRPALTDVVVVPSLDSYRFADRLAAQVGLLRSLRLRGMDICRLDWIEFQRALPVPAGALGVTDMVACHGVDAVARALGAVLTAQKQKVPARHAA